MADVKLGVNIDHVATLREARKTYEPDPVWAAVEAELGGADSITVHLREDRRHINDRDVRLLRETVQTPLNLEMSLAQEIADIAFTLKPSQATLVPEKREEVTTEGGLDLIAHADRTKDLLTRLQSEGIFVSAFIDPDPVQVGKAKELGFDAIELHTGSYANAAGIEQHAEFKRIVNASHEALKVGLQLHAGHGLNYQNTLPIASIKGMHELNIGHAIISRSVFIGLRAAVREMKDLLNRAEPKTKL